MVGVRDTSSLSGLLLVMRTVTPPCAVAPSRAVPPPAISPAPTKAGTDSNEIPGELTVTVTGTAARTPVAVALTVVVPPPMGSKATPPAATVDGELSWPGTIVTVRVWPAPLVLTNCATAGFVWLIVTDSGAAPVRNAWNCATAPDAFSTPMLTENALIR